jgi:hypothetical protein
MQHEIAISMALTHMLANGKFTTTNAVVLLKEIVERLETDLPKIKKEDKIKYVVHFLSEIAKGKDGVSGTDDDIISESVVKELQKMTETNILTDIIQLCMEAVQKRKVNPTKWSLCCLKCT